MLGAESLGRLKDMIRGLCDPLQIGLDRVAECGQGGTRLALEELATQFALKRADGICHRRLSHAAALGGTGETAFLAQRQEVANLVHLHVCPKRFESRYRSNRAIGEVLPHVR